MKTPRARRMETQIPTKLLRETKLRGSCSRVGTVEGTGGARGPLGRPSRLVSCPCWCAPSTAPCGRGGKAARHSLPRACPRHLRADSWGGVPQFVHAHHAAWVSPGRSAAELAGAHGGSWPRHREKPGPQHRRASVPRHLGSGLPPPSPQCSDLTDVHSRSRGPGRRVWPQDVLTQSHRTGHPGCWLPLESTEDSPGQQSSSLEPRPWPGSLGAPCFSCVLLCRAPRWARFRTQR